MNLYNLSDAVILACEIILKASLLLGLAAFTVSKIRQKFPSTAHLTWVLAFVIVFVLPIASMLVPGKDVLFLNLRTAVPLANRKFTDPAKQISKGSAAVGAGQSSQSTFGHPEAGPQEPPALLVLILSEPWAVAVSVIWFIGFLAVASRSGYGFYCLRMIRRFGTNPMEDEDRLLEAERLARQTGQHRAFDLRICATSELPIPMTWGVIRPTIVLPRDADTWSDKRFEATMLHELSHVRRYDFATQLMAEFVCALYWFNPLVWLSARTMRSDAELAADEAVLHSGLRPSDYAAELLSLAADLGKKPIPFATLGTPAMTNSKIETRLESILAPTAGRRGITTVQVLAALAITALGIPAFAAFHATAQTAEEAQAERATALNNAKQIALASLMYSNDYDDALPYVQQTASAAQVLQPYCKNQEIFQSPTKGGRFLMNMNLAGVLTSSVEYPAETPLWIEHLPNPKMKVAVAFLDGHAKLIDPNAEPDAARQSGILKGDHLAPGTSWLKAISAKKFPRSPKMKPLPYNYLLPEKP